MDLIFNMDTDRAADRLLFGVGIAEDQLVLARSGGDLVVSVLGTADRASLERRYSDAVNQLDRFELADGATLAGPAARGRDVGLPAALGAIAALSAPQQQVVETAIAANWHSAG